MLIRRPPSFACRPPSFACRPPSFVLALALLIPTIAAAAVTHRPLDTTTLTVLEPGPVDTLNPLLTRTAAGVDATAGIFDSLLRLDASGTFRPDLALSWSRSVDARTWTFTLDPRAHWQDGEPVTAEDVAFTARLVRDARFGAVSTRGFDGITSITIGGANLLTVTLGAAFAPFLATFGVTPILPSHILGDMSPQAVRDDVAFNRHPVGSGPFAAAELTASGEVIEEANPDYAAGAPRIDRLIIAPASSRTAALAAARDGTALLPPSWDLTPAETAAFTSAVPAAALYTPSFAWTHLDLIEHGALADPLVRRALAYATPRDAIIARVLHGHGYIDDGDQAPSTPAYEPAVHNSYHYDIHAARALLKRAGYTILKGRLMGRDKAPLAINLWGDAGCATCAETLALIAQGWRTAGISPTIRLVPTATLFGPHGPLYSPGRFTSSEYDAVLYAWVNGPDPDDSSYWTRGAMATTNPLGGNFTGYANAAVDALITRALITPSGPGRYALYRQVQRILRDDEPDVFLYWADNVSIVPHRLHGYSPTPYNSAATWNVHDWSLAP